MKFLDVLIKRPVFTTMLVLVFVVFGLFSYPKVGVDLFPPVEFPFVSVSVIYPGADPESMEQKVAKPIEDALSSMGGIKMLQSINLESASMVLIQFELDVDGDKAVQDVRDKIAGIQAQLPEGMEPPTIQKFDVGAIPIMSLALSSDKLGPRELTEFADDVVKERIQRIQGVGNVEIVGGRAREIHVELDPAALAARGLTPADVAMALQGQNLELPAGLITEGDKELVVTTKGAFTTVQEITEAPIVAMPGQVVRIGDVAHVLDDMADARSYASIDGKPAVALVIQKTSGTNTVKVAHKVYDEIAAMQAQLDEAGAKLTITADNTPFIERSFHEVQNDLLLGAILAIVIIFGFLRDWRATFISALALPASVIVTIFVFDVLGFTFNQMTMLALSLSIGLLIDDAIVVIENIHRHLEMGKPPMQAAAEGTKEIALAVLATTLSIVAVFVPVATMKGIVGRFFFQFGITVAVAVMVSLVVSFTLTPMLSARMLKVDHGKKFFLSRAIEWFLVTLERIYRAILRLALRQRALTLVVAVIALVGTCAGIAPQIKNEFLPAEDRSLFSIDVELPTGKSLASSKEVIEAIATDVRDTAPGVKHTFVTIGSGAQGQSNIGKVQVILTGPKERGFVQQDLMAWARERYKPLIDKGLKITVNTVDAVGGDSGFKQQPVQFNLRGKDMPSLIKAAEDLKAELAKIKGFVDIDSTYRGGKPQLVVQPDRAAAAELGVPVASIATTLRALVARDKVTDFKENLDIYDVKLTVSEETEAHLQTLSNLSVRSTSGQLVALSSVVALEPGLGPSQIDRQNRMRQITVLAGLDGLALGEASTKVVEAADKVVPSSIVKETGGMGQVMAESFGYMMAALLLAIVLVYIILAAQFESLIHPFTIMLSLPFAVIGAMTGLFLTGHTLNIFSMIGLIMLMGLVTKNAILLIDFANRKKEEGMNTRDALLAAGPIRLRPILMTTAAMILGMMPVALALGEGGETRAGMAVIVIGGLISSTLLTLVVVPVVFSLFEGMRERIWRRKKPPVAVVLPTPVGE